MECPYLRADRRLVSIGWADTAAGRRRTEQDVDMFLIAAIGRFAALLMPIPARATLDNRIRRVSPAIAG